LVLLSEELGIRLDAQLGYRGEPCRSAVIRRDALEVLELGSAAVDGQELPDQTQVLENA
jgi:hypothetical protein